jgi:hypothetical protein
MNGTLLSVTADIVDIDCTTGPTTLVETYIYDGGAETITPLGGVVFKQCPDNRQPKLFIFYGQMDASAPFINSQNRNLTVHSFDPTVLVCTPNHTLQEALVTTDPLGALIGVELQKTSEKIDTSPWDFWSAFNISLQAASPTFLVGPDQFSRSVTSPYYAYDAFFAAILASFSRQPAEYLNPDTLLQDSRRLYTTTAGQIANRYMRADSMRAAPGSYQTSQLRVILRDTAFRIIEAGLAMLIISACLILIFSPFLSTSSITLASLAVKVHRSGQLKSQLCRSGKKPLEQLKISLEGQSFSSNNRESERSNSVQVHKPKITLPTSSTSIAEIVTWWRPVAFSVYMKIIVLTLPLIIVACLETTYQVSRKKHGLDNSSPDQYWHYAWTWIPASTMTLIGLLYSSAAWSVALLDPYSILRTSSVSAKHALRQVNLSKPSAQLIYQGLRLKRYALFVVSVSALLAPLLTIIVSGLIFVGPVHRSEDIVVPLGDHILNSAPKSNINDWSQMSLSAANLLHQGYGSYPKGTHKNFVFPNLEQQPNGSIPPTGARLLNASSIEVDVGVMMSNFTCRVMDPAGFRSVTIPYKESLRIYGDAFLNFTHVDFADYRCEEPGPYCDNGMLTTGFKLFFNSTRFSQRLYGEDLYSEPWTDCSEMPENDALIQAIAARNKTAYVTPYITFFYGSWNDTATHLYGIKCYTDVRQGRANVTYDLSTHIVTSVQPSKEEFGLLADYDPTASPWGFQTDLDSLLANGNLWKTALNNTPEAFFDTPLGSAQLATQISDLYNTFYVQYYNTALRTQNFTAGTNFATATLYDDNFPRIFQSAISTRILEALLLAMWLCACIVYYLFDTKTLLPKNPCSIAAQASLLADSKFLDMIPEGAENATLEELIQMTPFRDHLFSMGWWDDGNGGRRFGIDVGMADFDKGEDDVNKVEESEESGVGVGEVGESRAGKLNARVSVDIVGFRV